MQGPELFALSVVVYSVLPLVFANRRNPFRFLLLYTHIAATLTLGGILGSVYVLPVGGDVAVRAGTVAYGGFMFATLVIVIVGRDLQVVRNVIALTVCVNVLVSTVFALTHEGLASGTVQNVNATAPAVFDQSLDVVVLGGLLIIAELVLLMTLVELAKRRLGPWGMALAYPVSYVAILLLDGVLFPLLVVRPPGDLGDLVVANLETKAVLAGAFVVPLMVFVAFYRPTLKAFEERPLELRHLLSLSLDDLLLQLDSQQLELQEQRARILDSTADFGRATATVDRILDSATNTILIALDPQMQISQFNVGAQLLLGYDAPDVRGRSMEMFHTDAEVARHASALGTTPDHAQVLRVQMAVGVRRDWEFIARDDTRHMVSLSISEVVADGTVVGYIAAGEDVTSRLRAETAMMTALSREHDALLRLQEVDHVKNELVSTVSHELRTPISSITGYAEMLHDGAYGELTSRQIDALERVLRNTQRLEQLVDDLLVLERVEAGPLPLECEPLDLRDVVRGSADMLGEMFRGRQLDLKVDLSSSEVGVTGDRAALERMVLNLVSNAVKFTPGPGSVSVHVKCDESTAWLSVSDTGIGIAAEDQELLFTKFFRTREANDRAIPGSGLGLSIVHSIVVSHDGAVSVASTPGQGTTVTVSLPLARVAAA